MSVWLPVLQYGLAAGIGVGGTVVGLVLKAELDRRSDRRTRRKALVDEWRQAIQESWATDEEHIVLTRGQGAPICHTAAWMSLREHLPTELVRELEGRDVEPTRRQGLPVRTTVISFNGNLPMRNRLVAAVARIEKDWGLV
jgi:hypothetical protein